MWDFSIGTSFALVLRTYPFMLIRAAVYFGLAAAFVVAAGGGAGLGWAAGAIAGPSGRVPGAFWGAIGGIAFVALMLRWLREYVLYLIGAGHAAAMVLALDLSLSPADIGQFGRSIALVQQRFRDLAVLNTIDRLVRGTLADLLRAVSAGAGTRPDIVAPVASLAVGVAATSLGEIVHAATLRSPGGNPWSSSRDTLIAFAQNHRSILRNAIRLAGLFLIALLFLFLLALIPAAALVDAFPGGSLLLAYLLAAIFAWSVKRALIDPFVLASLLQVYLQPGGAKQSDLDWDARLTEISGDFRELKARSAPARSGTRRA